jgi:tRNA nucleotidyltransferase/poly(A) polymerase
MVNFGEILRENEIVVTASKTAGELNFGLYIVGGYVRDLLLGRQKNEIDFLVTGDSLLLAKVLAEKLGAENVNLFKNFGTAHFYCKGMNLEFVSARKESYSRDSRKPYVESGTFDDDIKRRDFTINTLAVSINGENFGFLIDTFNGLEDLDRKLIKTPLDPMVTFDDDPLRIMRAYRFASALNFTVAREINDAANKLRDRLKIVSQERITDEFIKILMSPRPSVGLKLLFNSGVMSVIFPEIARLGGVDQRKDFHHKDVFLHTCMVVDNISQKTDNVWLRFAALVHDIAKPDTKKFYEGTGWTFHGHEDLGAKMMKSVFQKLKLPLNRLEYVEKLVRLHLRPIALASEEVTDSAIRRLIVLAGEDLHDLITLCRADITSKNLDKVSKYLDNYERVMRRVLEVEEKDKLRAFQSPVSGDVIMSVCGLSPSKKVGQIKSAIEDAILDGEIGNNYEEAYSYLLKIKERFL